MAKYNQAQLKNFLLNVTLNSGLWAYQASALVSEKFGVTNKTASIWLNRITSSEKVLQLNKDRTGYELFDVEKQEVAKAHSLAIHEGYRSGKITSLGQFRNNKERAKSVILGI
jgi:hypothetical protein